MFTFSSALFEKLLSFFFQKCKQYMHDLLLGLRKHDGHDYHELKVVINIGIMVYDFFSIYKKCEPDAIASYEELDKLLGNLNRGKLCNYISSNIYVSVSNNQS